MFYVPRFTFQVLLGVDKTFIIRYIYIEPNHKNLVKGEKRQ